MSIPVTEQDALFLRITGTTSRRNVVAAAGVRKDDGSVSRVTLRDSLDAASASQVARMELTDGDLVYLEVYTPDTSVSPGDVYAAAGLTKGSSGGFQNELTLCNGYVSSLGGVSYPHGSNESITGGRGEVISITASNPGAGVASVTNLDDNHLWHPLAIRFTFQTDANVANRFVRVEFANGVVTVAHARSSQLQPASQTYGYYFWYPLGATEAVDTVIQVPMPNLLLPGAGQITIWADNGQAGDQLSSIMLTFEAWQHLSS